MTHLQKHILAIVGVIVSILVICLVGDTVYRIKNNNEAVAVTTSILSYEEIEQKEKEKEEKFLEKLKTEFPYENLDEKYLHKTILGVASSKEKIKMGDNTYTLYIWKEIDKELPKTHKYVYVARVLNNKVDVFRVTWEWNIYGDKGERLLENILVENKLNEKRAQLGY